jgi:hypothetical protein
MPLCVIAVKNSWKRNFEVAYYDCDCYNNVEMCLPSNLMSAELCDRKIDTMCCRLKSKYLRKIMNNVTSNNNQS